MSVSGTETFGTCLFLSVAHFTHEEDRHGDIHRHTYVEQQSWKSIESPFDNPGS